MNIIAAVAITTQKSINLKCVIILKVCLLRAKMNAKVNVVIYVDVKYEQ